MTRAGIAFLAAPIVIGTGFGADVYSLVAGLAPATVVTLLALSSSISTTRKRAERSPAVLQINRFAGNQPPTPGL